MNILNKNDRKLIPIYRTLKKVNALKSEMMSLDDSSLKERVANCRDAIQKHGRTNALLPVVYAATREASRRVLEMEPYDVQLLGAIALHRGKIAEMKTGEGKTLTAALPLVLNALTGESAFLVTMNDYLAARDAAQLTPLYNFLGLSCASGVSEDGSRIPQAKKKGIYDSDIVYTTHSALGFDYLIHNLASTKEERFLRPFSYCIIDEADAVLLDSAHTPLVISGAPRVQSNLYEQADDFVSMLAEGRDYEQGDDNESVFLTEEGVRRAERFFRTENLFADSEAERMRHIILALRAHVSYRRDEQYILTGGTVVLLDSASGRVLENTKLRSGQHQAIEAKEHTPLSPDTRAIASITYQDFFALFPHVSGMTGSAMHDSSEMKEIYHLDVVQIPTNRPKQRIDHPDLVFETADEQIQSAVTEITSLYEKGQPVLVIVDNISTTDLVSAALLEREIPHNVLNAHNVSYEARIIAEAGRPGAVTVATSIAGRGTDIKLSGNAKELGGLAVIAIGRMDNERQETQVRGRSGRQGDPGFSRFYVSLEDDIFEEYGLTEAEREKGIKHTNSRRRMLSRTKKAQRNCARARREQRRLTMRTGKSMRRQRDVIYAMRNEVLDGGTISPERLKRYFGEVIDSFLDTITSYPAKRAAVSRFVMDHICYRMEGIEDESVLNSRASLRSYLTEYASRELESQMSQAGNDAMAESFLNLMTLKAIDTAWIEQVDYLQQLRLTVSGRAFAGRDTVREYHNEAYVSFSKMEREMKRSIMRNILLGIFRRDETGNLNVIVP